ncbi:hypothetical protein [Paraglaciecola sp.]|uniref:hypothetical protein n=1 Tax=Paraglaciecola sp. TaxID=1920173 RepID=UPI0030F44989
MRNSKRFSLLTVCLVWLLNTSALSGATHLYAQNLVVGVEDVSYYPYFDFAASDTSFSKSVLDKFAADMGHTISYVPLPIKQFSKWLYENNVDFKFPDNKRWQDASESDSHATYFSNSVLYLRAGTIVLARNKDKPAVFFKNLGMVTGFYPTLWIDKIAKKRVSLLDDTSPKVLVKHLVNEIVDGIDIDIAVANHYLKELNANEQLVYSSKLTQEVFGHQLSTIKYPEIIEQFNQWLAKNPEYLKTLKQQFAIPEVLPNKVQLH